MINPWDETWWQAGSTLNWWDAGVAARPAWMPDPDTARRALEHDPRQTARAIALIRSMRTIETGQLHALDPRLPATMRASLWMNLASCRLIDIGFPVTVNGQGGWGPRSGGFMAVRLPIHRTIDADARRIIRDPILLAGIGPTPWRGQRQYERHNLICTQLAIQARAHGWVTAGEAWCRFDRIVDDPLQGKGGPDLSLIGGHGALFVELTASTGIGIERKFMKWDRLLAHPRAARMQVVWVAAGHGGPDDRIMERIGGLAAGRARHHAVDGRRFDEWLEREAPDPGDPVPDSGWPHRDMRRLGRVFGMPDADRWRLPARLEAEWMG